MITVTKTFTVNIGPDEIKQYIESLDNALQLTGLISHITGKIDRLGEPERVSLVGSDCAMDAAHFLRSLADRFEMFAGFEE